MDIANIQGLITTILEFRHTGTTLREETKFTNPPPRSDSDSVDGATNMTEPVSSNAGEVNTDLSGSSSSVTRKPRNISEGTGDESSSGGSSRNASSFDISISDDDGVTKLRRRLQGTRKPNT